MTPIIKCQNLRTISLEFLDDDLYRRIAVLDYVPEIDFGNRHTSACIRLYAHAVDKDGRTLAVLVIRVVIGSESVVVLRAVVIHLLAVRALVTGNL